MKVKELKALLAGMEDEAEIVFKTSSFMEQPYEPHDIVGEDRVNGELKTVSIGISKILPKTGLGSFSGPTDDPHVWIMDRIENLRMRQPIRQPSRQEIWQGSYDVIYHEDDVARYRQIMTDRMEATKAAGYIANYELWRVTSAGRDYYREAVKNEALQSSGS